MQGLGLQGNKPCKAPRPCYHKPRAFLGSSCGSGSDSGMPTVFPLLGGGGGGGLGFFMKKGSFFVAWVDYWASLHGAHAAKLTDPKKPRQTITAFKPESLKPEKNQAQPQTLSRKSHDLSPAP